MELTNPGVDEETGSLGSYKHAASASNILPDSEDSFMYSFFLQVGGLVGSLNVFFIGFGRYTPGTYKRMYLKQY